MVLSLPAMAGTLFTSWSSSTLDEAAVTLGLLSKSMLHRVTLSLQKWLLFLLSIG